MLFANGTDACLNTDYDTSTRTQDAEEPEYVLFYIAKYIRVVMLYNN